MCGGQGQLLGIGSLPSTLLRWESLVLSFASFQASWPELLDDSPVTVFHPAVQTLRLQVHTTTYGLQMRITTSGLQTHTTSGLQICISGLQMHNPASGLLCGS